MSYAARLVAMSSGHAPKASAHVVGGTAEAPQEQHVETALRAPAVAATAATIPTPARPPVMSAVARTQDVARSDEPQREPARPAVHETIERHTLDHRSIAETAPPPRALPDPSPRPAKLPPPAQWLDEDPATSDPLVATAETDALRDLMRSVRQWTSSPPTIIETPTPAVPVTAAPGPSAAEPSHVTIGNVVITVEDAPAAHPSGAGARSPARSTSDRMSRNHIRGG
jgi:hypothetical protein